MTSLTPFGDHNAVQYLSFYLTYSSIFIENYYCHSKALNVSNFLAANLYSRSVFGEDALVNVSVERKDDTEGKLTGYIRIRSKTQGIALSLGDRITTIQRVVTPPELK
jgi:hypothetical protein